VDTLKIDRSFVNEIATDEPAAALTASIVAMGNALGLRVVAEGVEHEQQRRVLHAWGCHVAPGFLFGRAVPGHEAAATSRGEAASAEPRRSRERRTDVAKP
jgi:EAL domain-containing protein (putative c-di-GMP-specific phosphodiesterase class I)